jgi:hypothetical protein
MAPDQAISNWKKLVFATVVVAATFLIAALAQADIVKTALEWNQRAIDAVTTQVMGGIDRGTHARQLHQLARMLEWFGHHEQERLSAFISVH